MEDIAEHVYVTALKIFLVVVFSVILLSSCGGGGSSSSPPQPSIVTGHLVDADSFLVADALISINSDRVEGYTDAEGDFLLQINAGSHRLVASKNGVILSEFCFTSAEGVTYDFGTIDHLTPANCFEPSPSLGDADGDGLLDSDEEAGWMVSLIHGDGTVERYEVSSDPGLVDSDGDGLYDNQERAARTDPNRSDTDGDLLSDYAELRVYKSHPNRMDSDGDSCDPDSAEAGCNSDPNLWDGYELTLSNTSPTLSDTDGDGISDYEEINVGGTNPRLADLPTLALELHGNPLIELDVTDTGVTTTETVELAREETNQTNTDSESTKMSIENTVELKIHAEAGTSAWPPSGKVTLDTETKFKHGYFHNTSSSWKEESVTNSQQKYEALSTKTVNYADGKISVAMKLVNKSDLSFKLKDLRVVAFRQLGGGSFGLIGTMVPDSEWPAEGYTLGPSSELTMTMSTESVGAEVMRSLVRAPSALLFEVGAYSLFQLDEWGVEETVNYAKLGEGVLQRTGLVVVDYGNGRVDRYMVATNVQRNPDGSERGILVKEALTDIIGVDYEVITETLSNEEGNNIQGKQVLYRVRNVQAYDVCSEQSKNYDPLVDCEIVYPRGFWLIGGTGDDFSSEADKNFEDLMLHNAERINLTYVEDSDGDGVFNREEYLLGTRQDVPDTDGDNRSDFQESREGWWVAVDNTKPYEVFSDPRFSDVDGDFLSDSSELSIGTDPYLANTDGDAEDGDSLNDNVDPYPLSPPCLDGEKLNMTTWWDGSVSQGVVRDIVGDHDIPSVSDLVLDQAGNAVFQFNPGEDQNDQYMDVAVLNNLELSPYRELSFSVWIYWHGIATGKEWATLMSKGEASTATYSLSINKDGNLKFSLNRNARIVCEEYVTGYTFLVKNKWVDNECPDYDDEVIENLESVGKITPNQWVNVIATFSGNTMMLYQSGADEPESRSVISTNWVGDEGSDEEGDRRRKDTTTNNLVANDDSLRIGGEFVDGGDPQSPYRGLLDDVQIFDRGLNVNEMMQLNRIGACSP